MPRGMKPRHGHASRSLRGKLSPTYNTWVSMLTRVRNKNIMNAHAYVGIDVDPRWEKFENFLSDMGEKPAGTSIDRIDGSLGYSAANCRWASPTLQCINQKKRSNTASKYKGVTKSNRGNTWVARISRDRKCHYLGSFPTEEQAAEAYQRAKIKIHGDLL